jgi:hypothetical protein
LLTRPSWRHMQRRWREKQHSCTQPRREQPPRWASSLMPCRSSGPCFAPVPAGSAYR